MHAVRNHAFIEAWKRGEDSCMNESLLNEERTQRTLDDCCKKLYFADRAAIAK
jgi:hypothetical protein